MIDKTFNGTLVAEIIKKLPPIDQKINAKNYGLFETYGIYDSNEKRHNCVLCGLPTSIDNSISNRGNRLINICCVYRFFEGDYSVASAWCRGDYDETH